MASDNIVIIDNGNWETEVIQSSASVPVLVDFWAEWCGPCRAIAPILDQLADELNGKLKIAKVDLDQHLELANQFGIRSIPTLLVFKDGEVAETVVGAVPKTTIEAKIQPFL